VSRRARKPLKDSSNEDKQPARKRTKETTKKNVPKKAPPVKAPKVPTIKALPVKTSSIEAPVANVAAKDRIVIKRMEKVAKLEASELAATDALKESQLSLKQALKREQTLINSKMKHRHLSYLEIMEVIDTHYVNFSTTS
jgi:hypothetical protein